MSIVSRLFFGWLFFISALVSTADAIQHFLTADKVSLSDAVVAVGIAFSLAFWQLLCFGFTKKPKP